MEEVIQFVLERSFDQIDQKKQDGLEGQNPISGEAGGSDSMSLKEGWIRNGFFEISNQAGIQIAEIVTS